MYTLKCSTCGIFFERKKRCRNAEGNYDCKLCNGKRATRIWASKNKVAKLRYNLKRKYGLTLEEYMKLLKRQGGLCAICKTHKPSKGGRASKKMFAVDHDHSTGKVRGLLCNGCNVGLGNLQDNKQICYSAYLYLKAFE